MDDSQLRAQGATSGLLRLHSRASVPLSRLTAEERRQLRVAAAPRIREPERRVPAPFGVAGFRHPDAKVVRAKSRWLRQRGQTATAQRATAKPQRRQPRTPRTRRSHTTNGAHRANSPPRLADEPPAFCDGCGERFDPASPRQRYCSADCRNRAKQRRHYWRHHPVTPTKQAEPAEQPAPHVDVGEILARVNAKSERRLQLLSELPSANGNRARLVDELRELEATIPLLWNELRAARVAA